MWDELDSEKSDIAEERFMKYMNEFMQSAPRLYGEALDSDSFFRLINILQVQYRRAQAVTTILLPPEGHA
jgi:hypothetical protein